MSVSDRRISAKIQHTVIVSIQFIMAEKVVDTYESVIIEDAEEADENSVENGAESNAENNVNADNNAVSESGSKFLNGISAILKGAGDKGETVPEEVVELLQKIMSDKDYSPLSALCVRALSDKSYERRRSAAFEIQK